MSRNLTFTPVDPQTAIALQPSGAYVIDDDRIQERLDRVTGRTEALWIHPETLTLQGVIVHRPLARSICWYDLDGELVHRVVLGGAE